MSDDNRIQHVDIDTLADEATVRYAEYLEQCGVINSTDYYTPSKVDYLTLAKASRLLRLDPVAKEIYFIGGKDNKKVGVVVASFVHTRNAKRAAKRTGDDIDINYYMLTPEMNKQHRIADGDVAVEARLTSLQSGQVWYQQARTVAELVKIGVYTPEQARELIGQRPYISAVGIVRATERFGDESRYARSDRARKRATKAVITTGGYKVTNYEAALIAHGLADEGEDGPAGFGIRMPDVPALGAGDVRSLPVPGFMADGIDRVTMHVGHNTPEHNAHALGRDEPESLLNDAPMPVAAAIPTTATTPHTEPDPLTDTVDALVEQAEQRLAAMKSGKSITKPDVTWLNETWHRVWSMAAEAGLNPEPIHGQPTPLLQAEGIVRVGRQIIAAQTEAA